VRSLLARYPGLAAALSRVDLRVRETAVERWRVDGVSILIKRDDLSTPSFGGNKARALEMLLTGAGPDVTVLTVGAEGSTHALAVAHFARRLGAACEVITWPQETNEISLRTAARLSEAATVTRTRSVVEAYVRATVRRFRRGTFWVPAGGSVPRGALAHVNAALELVDQLERDGLDMPAYVVVPLGTGGTAAGLLVGLSIARVRTRLVAVRVVPRIVANRARVLRLARRTRRLLERLAGETIPPCDAEILEIDESAYGGAYGWETPAAQAAALALHEAGGPTLDATYSAKAFGVALRRAQALGDGSVLFWLTFDARWLAAAESPAPPVSQPGY